MSRPCTTILIFLIFFSNLKYVYSSTSNISQTRQSLKPSMQNLCFGYEGKNICQKFNLSKIPNPICHSKLGSKVDKSTLKKTFNLYADFGYVYKKIKQKTEIFENFSCIHHLRYCEGGGIFLKFGKMGRGFSDSGDLYRTDVVEGFGPLRHPEKKANFTVNEKFINANADHIGALQSWGTEVKTILTTNPNISKQSCDHTIKDNVIFLKIDAGVNMYHHFCDFINLWLSQHLNNDFAFDTKTQFVIWQTSGNYWSYYSDTVKLFTDKPFIHLTEFSKKKVCFEGKVMFPLLSRQRFGFYYNMPLPKGCSDSFVFKSFSEHLKFRLDRFHLINGIEGKKGSGSSSSSSLIESTRAACQVTFLSRGTYQNKHKSYNPYNRLVKNEKSLIKKAEKYFKTCNFQVVQFTKEIPFFDQISIMRKTDLFISMHGAGLTQMLFLPDNAKVIELFNCNDFECYKDLARLRGVKYFTWTDLFYPEFHGSKINQTEVKKVHQNDKNNRNLRDNNFIPFGIKALDAYKHHKYPKNTKFWNFEFDEDMFVELVRLAIPEFYELDNDDNEIKIEL